MHNWEVIDKRIYQLLKHPYQIDKSIVEDMTSAYLDFVEELFIYLNKQPPPEEVVLVNNDNEGVAFNTFWVSRTR